MYDDIDGECVEMRSLREGRCRGGEGRENKLTISEISALVAVVLSVGTNVALYVHLSSTMNSRFDIAERKFESRFSDLKADILTILRTEMRSMEAIMDARLSRIEESLRIR
ncbi:MAG: hypothetical protein M3Z09_10865 [Acidobacteriota bacterium]|nr:hypothetical protein [Acidobacteriota bacterium]